MARIISVAWTAPAVRARAKFCTRRDWPDSYARLFHEGDLVQLYDKTPRAGGKLICLVRLTVDPVKMAAWPLLPGDWEKEGFTWLTLHGFKCGKITITDLIESWISDPREMWVIRWEYLEDNQPAITAERKG